MTPTAAPDKPLSLNCYGVTGAGHHVRRADRYWLGPRARPGFLCAACADALRRTGMDVVPAERRSEMRPDWTESELRLAWGDR